jgi:hypothetical protein
MLNCWTALYCRTGFGELARVGTLGSGCGGCHRLDAERCGGGGYAGVAGRVSDDGEPWCGRGCGRFESVRRRFCCVGRGERRRWFSRRWVWTWPGDSSEASSATYTIGQAWHEGVSVEYVDLGAETPLAVDGSVLATGEACRFAPNFESREMRAASSWLAKCSEELISSSVTKPRDMCASATTRHRAAKPPRMAAGAA